MAENMSDGGSAVFTVASRNCLAHARTLMASVKLNHPGAHRIVVLCDRPWPGLVQEMEDFDILFVEELSIPNFLHFAFKYNALEFHTAVKPFAFRVLFEKGFEKVIFLDADTLLYAPMGDAFETLDARDIVLTPQLLHALPTARSLQNELVMLRLGAYNTGFVGVHRRAFEFLDWWMRNVSEHCINEPENGMFVDQKMMDLAPGLFDNVALLRHPGYNVMIYNLEARPLGKDSRGRLTVADQPLVFFHFTGIESCKPTGTGVRYAADNIDIASLGLLNLVKEYLSALNENGFEKTRHLNYAFDTFSNGVRIAPFVRRFYRLSVPPSSVDPFSLASSGSAFSMMAEPSPIPSLCTYAYAMHHKPEVSQQFPHIPGRDEEAYARWFIQLGRVAYSVPPEFIDAQRDLIRNLPLLTKDRT